MRHFLFTLVAVTPVVIGQNAHVVGPGSFAEIRDALAAAAPGDQIFVFPGNYAHFEASIPVTIQALGPGVNVQFDAAYLPTGCNNIFCLFLEGPTRIDLVAGEVVKLRGITFVGNTVTVGNTFVRHRVEVDGGTVFIEDCTFDAIDSAALTINNATAHCRGITATSATVSSFVSTNGMEATSSYLAVVDSSFQGGNGLLITQGAGIRLSQSTLVGSGLMLLGAQMGPGLYSNGANEIWLSDSTIVGGGGNCPLVVLNATGGLDRCTLSPAAASCSSLPQTPLIGVSQTGPPNLGQPFTVNWSTQPLALVAIVGGFDYALQTLPQVEQPWFLPIANSAVVGFTVADTSGNATATWTLPLSAPPDLALWLQAVSGTTLPVQAAPAAGGMLR